MAHAVHDRHPAVAPPRQLRDHTIAAAVRTPFRQRLGWRLTASYALVTVAVLAAMELVLLVGGVVWVVVALGRNGAVIERDLADRAAPAVAPLLAPGAPDLLGIDRWLRDVQTNGIVPEGDQRVQIRPDVSVLAMSETRLLVVDATGRLVGAIKQVAAPTSLEAAEAPDVPAFAEAVATALTGRASSTPFLQWPLLERVSVAVPVRDDQGSVVGALVFGARSPLDSSFEAVGRTLVLSAFSTIVFGAVIGTISGYLAARRLAVRFDRMAEAAAAWGAGDFSASVGDRAEDELGQLGRRLNRMAEQLADLIRTRERLSVVDERNRLARDLHDSVKQQAFAVSMHLGSARELWERDPATARRSLDAAYEIARQSQQELTAIIQTLRPTELADATIDRALGEYLAQWQTRTGIAARAEIAATAPLPHPVEDALFRVAQEALTNVARHSRASHVRVDFARDDDSARLEIADDGTGFEVRRTHPGVGLQAMRERVEALGGVFTQRSDAAGTRVSVRIPLAEPIKG